MFWIPLDGVLCAVCGVLFFGLFFSVVVGVFLFWSVSWNVDHSWNGFVFVVWGVPPRPFASCCGIPEGMLLLARRRAVLVASCFAACLWFVRFACGLCLVVLCALVLNRITASGF